MHVYFSGIGGAGISPLALVAKQAGYDVSGSDKQHSDYIDHLKKHGVTDIHIGQTREAIAEVHARNPIDWFVHTSYLDAGKVEREFCQEHDIKISKRDELINKILADKNLKLIAIAGTHGKTTTTAMTVWLLQQLDLPISYLLPAKTSFAPMGAYDPQSAYFIYEADEYDRNFLAFHPYLSLISGIDWDHPDVYPTRQSYYQAFTQFINQSDHVTIWQKDMQQLSHGAKLHITVLPDDAQKLSGLTLPGAVNRQNALLVASALEPVVDKPLPELLNILNKFPGLSRRFEQIAPHVYSDYAHTPAKIRGALQLAQEVGGRNVVVVYEGLHNTRQHFIKDELRDLFNDVKQLYIVPSYLAREDKSLKLLTPADLKLLLSKTAQQHTQTAQLDEDLKKQIQKHVTDGDLVLCITAGGGNSLDAWLRTTF